MIETCEVFTTDLYGGDHAAVRELRKKYGSRRSGTIYIVARGFEEAEEVAREIFTSNGYTPPVELLVERTGQVNHALRMVF